MRVTSAAEGQALLASGGAAEAKADRVQRALVVAVPIVRRLARGARFTRVPWVLVGSSAVSTGLAVRTGLFETQVLGSLIAHRIEEETGQPADPALVKKLAAELYLAPKRVPDLVSRQVPLGRLVRRWAVRGLLGRSTQKAAVKALKAAERLEVQPHVDRWAQLHSRR